MAGRVDHARIAIVVAAAGRPTLASPLRCCQELRPPWVRARGIGFHHFVAGTGPWRVAALSLLDDWTLALERPLLPRCRRNVSLTRRRARPDRTERPPRFSERTRVQPLLDPRALGPTSPTNCAPSWARQRAGRSRTRARRNHRRECADRRRRDRSSRATRFAAPAAEGTGTDRGSRRSTRGRDCN